MASAAIGWQAMGKPDFATCGKLFYRLPAELRESMNRSEEKVLIWTLFMTWWKAAHSGRGTEFASYSETWLAAKFGRSRWTVLRALARLESLSLVKRIRRSPKRDGTFQTNLIALSAKLTSVLSLSRTEPRDKSPCSRTAPQEVENVYKRDKAAPLEAPPLVSEERDEACHEKAKDLFGSWLKMTPPSLLEGVGSFAKSMRKAMRNT